MTGSVVHNHMGKCVTCWNKETGPTLVSPGPMSRCIDRAACELRRLGNATGARAVTRTATVETVRRHSVHYFRVVRKYVRDEKGVEQLVRNDLELVPTRERATKFPPDVANRMAIVWNAVAREV